jgi:hypothetical protein
MDLGGLKVGDDVAVQATEAMAIELGETQLEIKIANPKDSKIPKNANATETEEPELDAGTPIKNNTLIEKLESNHQVNYGTHSRERRSLHCHSRL